MFANRASTKEAIENNAAQTENTGDDIAYPGRRQYSGRRGSGSSECEKEAADDGKSEAELVEVADTVKRAISERMRVISLPSHRRDTSFVVRETIGHTKRA